jgi:hypothetical protein
MDLVHILLIISIILWIGMSLVFPICILLRKIGEKQGHSYPFKIPYLNWIINSTIFLLTGIFQIVIFQCL